MTAEVQYLMPHILALQEVDHIADFEQSLAALGYVSGHRCAQTLKRKNASILISAPGTRVHTRNVAGTG